MYLCMFGQNQSTSSEIIHGIEKADPHANADANRIHTKNNISPTLQAGGHNMTK